MKERFKRLRGSLLINKDFQGILFAKLNLKEKITNNNDFFFKKQLKKHCQCQSAVKNKRMSFQTSVDLISSVKNNNSVSHRKYKKM